jgi:ferredoxin
VRVVVDQDRCESHGVCMAMVPEMFEVGDDDVLRVFVGDVPAELEAGVVQAVDHCPKQALSISAS